jgi:hypothetical protein
MMLSKDELVELRALALAHLTEPDLASEYVARILTSRVRDPGSQADMTEFICKVLLMVVKKHSETKDAAARQVCWSLMHAFNDIGERMIDEAPDLDPSSRTQ